MTFESNCDILFDKYIITKTLNRTSRRSNAGQRAGDRWKPGTGADVEWAWELQAESHTCDEYAVPESPPLSGLRVSGSQERSPVPANE
ncbi:MAG: hypothetical protein DRI52_02725 [Chloroflexi bacterium]|nr:MAG: hypothetical protein DRI52_02725 [Chloroflexota bacterium]